MHRAESESNRTIRLREFEIIRSKSSEGRIAQKSMLGSGMVQRLDVNLCSDRDASEKPAGLWVRDLVDA